MNNKNLFAMCLALYVLLCSGTLAAQAKPPDPELASAFRQAGITMLARPVPTRDFSVVMLSGETRTLESYRGKTLFLNFWATWCGPCKIEMPSMEVLYQRYKNRGLEMLAVNLQEEPAKVSPFIRENRLSFPVGLDQPGRAGQLYSINAIPTTFIVDKNGLIIAMIRGSISWSTPEVFAAFDKLLANE